MNTSITMPMFVNLIKEYIKTPINTIVEVGSLNGDDAAFLRSHFEGSVAYAIEGLEENFNTYILSRPDVIGIYEIICDVDRVVTYHIKNVNGIHGIFDRGQDYGTKKLETKCISMQTLCKKYSIPPIDVMKIDVEGATFEVLNGMGPLLDHVKIMHIETESFAFFQGQQLHGVVSGFLESRGFRQVCITSADIDSQQQHDSVWIRKES